MDDLIAGLNGSKGPDVRRGVGELDNLQQGVSLARASIGTNLNAMFNAIGTKLTTTTAKI